MKITKYELTNCHSNSATRKGNLEALATMRPFEWRLQPFLFHHDAYNGGIVTIDYVVGHVCDVLDEVVQVLLVVVKAQQVESGLDLDVRSLFSQHRSIERSKREKFAHQEILEGPLLS